MELCMKHNSNANIWHGSLFTGLTNTIYQICYFLPSSKLTFHINCFHGKLSTETKYPFHNSVNIVTKLENKKQNFQMFLVGKYRLLSSSQYSIFEDGLYKVVKRKDLDSAMKQILCIDSAILA